MDSLDKKSASGFFKHVFNFEDESKSEMSNIVQYSMLSLFPIVLLNKSMQKYVPEADEKKGSLEVLAEVVIQVVYMFLGLLFIHRIITYIPTYSGVDYPDFNVIFIILAVLMVVLSLQTKLGDKVGILVDRVVDLWEGKSGDKKGASTNVKVSQPISQGGGVSMSQSQTGYSDGTMLNQLPDMSSQQQQQQQQMPNYNSMYKQQSTPLVNAASPSGNGGGGGIDGFDNHGIMAANEALGGGGGFGSAW